MKDKLELLRNKPRSVDWKLFDAPTNISRSRNVQEKPENRGEVLNMDNAQSSLIKIERLNGIAGNQAPFPG